MLSPIGKVVCTGLVGAQKSPRQRDVLGWSTGCSLWPQGWSLYGVGRAAREPQLPQVPLGCPRSLCAGPALQLAHGSALGQVSARHSLYDHRQKQFSASPGPYGSKPWCVSTCCTPGQCWKLSRGCRVLGWATALGWATPSSGAA